jgi:WhiB family redox-sensing transcriptional regulator
MSNETNIVSRPNLPIYDWEYQAICRGLGALSFYVPDKLRGPSKLQHEERAKAICARCPVIKECLRQALDQAERYGIWGGMTPNERTELLKRQKDQASE